MKTTLPWTTICEERHEKVVAFEQECKAAFGSPCTRRQARKGINGRGRTLDELKARRAQEEAKP